MKRDDPTWRPLAGVAARSSGLRMLYNNFLCCEGKVRFRGGEATLHKSLPESFGSSIRTPSGVISDVELISASLSVVHYLALLLLL